MTLGTLRNVVTQKLGLAVADLPLVDQWINEGVVEVLRETACHVECADIATTAGVGDYTIDAKVLTIDEMEGRAEPVSPRTLLDYRQSAPSSDPDLRFYALAGSNLLMLYPTPSAAGEIHVYYTPMPQPMTAVGNDPSSATYGGVPVEYHKAIEFYALREGADYDDDRSSGVGQGYDKQFQGELLMIRRHMNRRLGRMPRARVGRSTRRPLANDVYPVY